MMRGNTFEQNPLLGKSVPGKLPSLVDDFCCQNKEWAVMCKQIYCVNIAMTGLFELYTVSVLLPVTERTEADVEDREEGAESRQRCPTGWSKYGSSCITANNWLSLQQTIRLQREAHYPRLHGQARLQHHQ
jgi:hypothetical protein